MYSSSQTQLKRRGPHRLPPGTPRPRPNLDAFPPKKPDPERAQKPDKQGNTQRTLRPESVKLSPRPSNENLPKFLIWVKNEPFDFGILSPLPCPKIGINILRKIAEYCREKPGHYPELSLNQWNHICKYKIQLTHVELCNAYFRVFDVLSRSASSWAGLDDAKDKIESSNESNETLIDTNDECGNATGESRDLKFNKMLNQGIDVKDVFKADTLQFLLFLYLQHFLRLHKKFSMRAHAGGDEPWPKHNSSRSSGPNAIIPEQQHAEFLAENLEDIIDFLMILHGKTNRKTGGSNTEIEFEEERIPLSVIRALSLILGAASITRDREFQWLDECLVIPEIDRAVEYDRIDFTVSKKLFAKWIKSNLKINPWGHSSVSIPQVPVSLMTGICTGDGGNAEIKDESRGTDLFKRNKIFWNTQCYPKAWFLISNVEKQTLLFDKFKSLSSIKITRCIDSNIYLPGAHNTILIQKCHGLNINIGVAAKAVKVLDCSNITLSGVGRLFIICDSVSSTFHLLTSSSPIICGNKNHKIQLAPYNTTYPTLESHMKTAGLSPLIQKWNKPLEISTDGFPHDHVSHDSNVSILRATHFKMAAFPFKLDSDEVLNESERIPSSFPPGLLSGPYQRSLTTAKETVNKVKKEYRTKLIVPPSQLPSNESINLLYRITLDRFKKWLKETGNYEQIMGLVSLQKSLEQDVPSPILLSTRQDLACVSKCLKKLFGISDRDQRSPSPLYRTHLLPVTDAVKDKPKRKVTSQQKGYIGGSGESLPNTKKKPHERSHSQYSYLS